MYVPPMELSSAPHRRLKPEYSERSASPSACLPFLRSDSVRWVSGSQNPHCRAQAFLSGLLVGQVSGRHVVGRQTRMHEDDPFVSMPPTGLLARDDLPQLRVALAFDKAFRLEAIEVALVAVAYGSPNSVGLWMQQAIHDRPATLRLPGPKKAP